jgi:hypothetical protein
MINSKSVSNSVLLKAQAIVDNANKLVKTREDWQTNEYARSNKRLYDILAEVLSMYEQVSGEENEDLRRETVKQMKQQLTEAGVRIQTNTLTLTLFVRFVFRTDRQRALNYSRTLQAAISEGINADKLAEFVDNCGGVEQCKKQFTKSEKVLAKERAIDTAMELVEGHLETAEKKPLATFKVDASFVADTHDKDFVMVLAKAEADGTVKVLAAVPAQSEGYAKWAKQKLALFLSGHINVADKATKSKQKTSAVDAAKAAAIAGAKEAVTSTGRAATETVGDLIAA